MAKKRSGRRGEAGAAPKPRAARVLVVDDTEGIRGYIAASLEARGYEVDTAEDGRRALALLESGCDPDIVLLDVMMPGIDGLETLRVLRESDEELPVVMLSMVGRADAIVEAMRLGANDYLTKPVVDEELVATLERLLSRSALLAQRDGLRAAVGDDPDKTVWQSEAMKRIQEMIEQIASTDVTVLIQGESGTGKEIVARAVHSMSNRSDARFVKVNCAALPEDLLESELFGYEKGAFTGAVSLKQGKFEMADGGTMFLDEIGEMSPGLQAKLLHVLQERRFTRLGGNEEIEVDVRVVSATHRPLLEMVKENDFREDLYFRLNVVNIAIPPLRERRDEIPKLVRHFLQMYGAIYGRLELELTPALESAFDAYSFPGNVRELENMIKRWVVLENEESILAEIRRRTGGQATKRSALRDLLESMEEQAGEIPLREVSRRVSLEAERETISRALDRTSWNRRKAAAMLGVSYKTLLHKIRDCDLEAPETNSAPTH